MMHGRRTISTDEQRLVRRRQQVREAVRAHRSRKKRKVVQFKVELKKRLVDKITAGLKFEINPDEPEPTVSDSEWDAWFGRCVLPGIIEIAVNRKK